MTAHSLDFCRGDTSKAASPWTMFLWRRFSVTETLAMSLCSHTTRITYTTQLAHLCQIFDKETSPQNLVYTSILFLRQTYFVKETLSVETRPNREMETFTSLLNTTINEKADSDTLRQNATFCDQHNFDKLIIIVGNVERENETVNQTLHIVSIF